MSAAHKSGFIALVGRPNAGKSALLNALLGQKLSIVSCQPQTTRHRILGILDGEGWQACFLDTPGWLEKADDPLQGNLIKMTRAAARDDADVVLLVVEPAPARPEDLAAFQRFAELGKPLILAVNKCDRVGVPAAEAAAASYGPLAPAAIHQVSALKGTGVADLRSRIINLLPESPPYYEKGQASDRWERFFAAEMVREALFELYREEIPHACAVDIERYKERPGLKDLIQVVVYVERPSQKGILLGAHGSAIRRLTQASLRRIEAFLGRPVELELWVKVRKDWRKDRQALKEFGYVV
ncbi:MAG TPA: GTPase Era [Elusimicrobia bacterium]|nr:GTPase Era [Elusimicrobiota bacterium]